MPARKFKPMIPHFARDPEPFADNILVILLSMHIRVYKPLISPLLPRCCRFTPSCSTYALQALAKYGPIRGSYLAVRRILRCHPWGGSGYGPVP